VPLWRLFILLSPIIIFSNEKELFYLNSNHRIVNSNHTLLEENVDKEHSPIFVKEKNSDILTVTFPYDPGTVEKIKNITGRKWIKEEKHWELPNKTETFLSLKKHFYSGITIDPSPYLTKLDTISVTLKMYCVNEDKFGASGEKVAPTLLRMRRSFSTQEKLWEYQKSLRK
jgi:hypothetical protein